MLCRDEGWRSFPYSNALPTLLLSRFPFKAVVLAGALMIDQAKLDLEVTSSWDGSVIILASLNFQRNDYLFSSYISVLCSESNHCNCQCDY